MRFMTNLNKPKIKLGISQENLTGYEEGLVFDSKSNPKRFWKYASPRKPGRHSVTEPLVNGNTVSTPIDIAAELSSQFKSVFTPPEIGRAHV